MGNTTISIDKETKEKAAGRAKKDKLTVSAIARILLNEYADGNITIGVRSTYTVNSFTPEFEGAVLLAKDDEGLAFDSAEKAIEHLHKKVA